MRLTESALIGFLVVGTLPALASSQSSRPMVVAYVFARTGVLPSISIDAQKLTRVNYAFANVEGGGITAEYPSDPDNMAALLGLKRQNPALTVLVSVGGWLWSGNFSDMSLTRISRTVFINSVIDFIERNRLDGLDIDWEYPGLPGAGHIYRPEDKENYTLLLKELHGRLRHEQKRLGRRLYLTIATGASRDFLAHTEMRKVQKYVDTVNLMAYDYYEPESDRVTGHHAPLFSNPADPKHISAESSVSEYERAGVPASKIVLGVPFYGHVWGEVGEANAGLFQAGKPLPGAYAPYGQIYATMLNNGYTRYWDPVSAAPYLYNAEKRIFVTYEDPESLRRKCAYILQHKLGGIMFWEYSSDPSGELLRIIAESLHANRTSAPATN